MKFYTNVSCQGNYIYYRGVDKRRRVRFKTEYSPSFFVPSKTPTKSSWYNLQGNPLEELKFDSIKEAKEYQEKYSNVDGFTLYGNSRFEYSYISDQHNEESIDWSIDDVVIAYLDIEVATDNGMPNTETCLNPITAITIKLSNNSYYHVFGWGNYVPHRDDIKYHRCNDEYDLLDQFVTFWSEECPDVVSGWNCKTFDIPYIIGRICNIPMFGELKAKQLSPFQRISLREENFYNKPQRVFKILGVAVLDYMQLFRKYSPNYNQESYKLDYIAHVELKERKIDYSEYDNLQHLYERNYQKFIEYNIHDVELVERLNAKGRLIDMALTLAYDNKTNYEDVFSQVLMWDVICYNHLRNKKIAVPPKNKADKDKAYEGAYVKDPQVGVHHWVASFDLNSLYPHLIMQYNLSPETLIQPDSYTEDMKDILRQNITVNSLLSKSIDLSRMKGYTITPNRQLFRTDKHGFLAEIMEKMYVSRVEYKKKQIAAQKEKETCNDPVRKKELENIISRYKNLQLAKKVGLNSAYGAMGNEFFRFFDVRIAEAVTLAGQLSIRWIETRLNEYMNKVMSSKGVDYVIASDTDSIYLNLGPLAHSCCKNNLTNKMEMSTKYMINWMDKVCEKIQKFIDDSYKELAEYVHAYAQKMQMKRESLVDTAIWTAKKRYILNVWDQEGVRYREPEIKIQGLEAIKSSTPAACRDKIKDALRIIMTETEKDIIDFIDKFRSEFSKLSLSEIAFPRTVNGLEEYRDSVEVYKKGAPIHVKGSLFYNKFIKDKGLINEYELIRSGEKIKFIYLREPNVLMTPVVAFPSRIPKEMNLEGIIDYTQQFEKSFVEPLRIVLNCIGWETEKSSTLEEFFN